MVPRAARNVHIPGRSEHMCMCSLSREGQPAVVPGLPGEAEEGEGSAALRSLPANLTVCFHHAGVPSPRTMGNSPGSLLSVCFLAVRPGELGARGCK